MSSKSMSLGGMGRDWVALAGEALRLRVGRLAAASRLRRDVAHLRAMSDAELRDLGIGRWQIEDAVAGRLASRR